jgi:phage shock protein A
MKKKIWYWLIGDRAGRVTVGIWNWLWGKPLEMNSEVAKEVAAESLQSMQASVDQLTKSVSKVIAVYQQAQEIYKAKQAEASHAEQQARLAHSQGNAETAQLAMTKVIQLETILPQLQERVEAAKVLMEQHKDRLQREHQRLEAYRMRMKNLESLAEINKALAVIAESTDTLQAGSARSQFDTAESNIKRQHFEGQAYADLSQNPGEALQTELDQLTLVEEVNRRLQRLDVSTSK